MCSISATPPGETGNAPDEAKVSSNDEILVRGNSRVFDLAEIGDPYDFNRDRLVSATDQIFARHMISILDALKLIAPPS